jgi:hypothetical protein
MPIDLAMGWYTPATWRELRAIDWPHARVTGVAHILDVVRPLLALHAPRARVAVKKAAPQP